MTKNFIPIMVEVSGEEKKWEMYITNLSLSELSKLRKDLLDSEQYTSSYEIESILRSNVDKFRSNSVCYKRENKIRDKDGRLIKRSKIKSRGRR